jgi:hypothetical protein
MPVLGFTWYSLTDQVDWDTGLREDNGRVNPLGLYDLDRKPRPVGKAYKKLIKDWQHVLPMQSVCLRVPIVLPWESVSADGHGREYQRWRQEQARRETGDLQESHQYAVSK